MNNMQGMPPGGLLGARPQQAGAGNVLGMNAVQLQKMYPMWQQQSIDAQSQGQPFPQFNEWIQMQQQGGQMMGTAP